MNFIFSIECDYRCSECRKESMSDSLLICTECKTDDPNRETTAPCKCKSHYFEKNPSKICEGKILLIFIRFFI